MNLFTTEQSLFDFRANISDKLKNFSFHFFFHKVLQAFDQHKKTFFIEIKQQRRKTQKVLLR